MAANSVSAVRLVLTTERIAAGTAVSTATCRWGGARQAILHGREGGGGPDGDGRVLSPASARSQRAATPRHHERHDDRTSQSPAHARPARPNTRISPSCTTLTASTPSSRKML